MVTREKPALALRNRLEGWKYRTGPVDPYTGFTTVNECWGRKVTDDELWEGKCDYASYRCPVVGSGMLTDGRTPPALSGSGPGGCGATKERPL